MKENKLLTNLIHEENKENQSFRKKWNENQFLEKKSKSNELNSKIYIYIAYIWFDHGSRESTNDNELYSLRNNDNLFFCYVFRLSL